MTVKVLHNQTLLDISIFLFGTAIGALPIAIENDISLTDELIVGQILKIPEGSDFEQRLIVEYFQNKGFKPATAINYENIEIQIPQDLGIGLMIIEDSFIVR